jgi:diguanylate cyclase (GGDEF)-like protein
MPRRAKAYVAAVLVVAALLFLLATYATTVRTSQWQTFGAFALLATIAQLYRTESPAHVVFRPSPIMFLASSLLLHPVLTLMVVAFPHLAQTLAGGRGGSRANVGWYLQALNVATYVTAGIAARYVYTFCGATPTDITSSGTVAVGLLSALIFVACSRLMLGPALMMLRKVSWRDAGILDRASLLTDVVVALVGLVVVVVWLVNPWFTVPVFVPLALLYTGSVVPAIASDSQTDYRTGLYSLRHFNTLLVAELDRAQRFNRPLTFVLLDVDGFRRIITTFGQTTGDFTLTILGQVLKRALRQYDIAGRYDRDKFAIIVPETDPTEAAVLARRIHAAIASANFDPGDASKQTIGSITACIGISCCPSDGTTPVDLWQAAEAALGLAKTRGPNSLVFSLEVPPETRHRQAASGVQLPVSLALPAFVGNPALARNRTSAETRRPTPLAHARSQSSGTSVDGEPRRTEGISRYLGPFISATIATAILTAVAGIAANHSTTLSAVGLLAALAAITELLQVDLYGRGTVSVSMALTFTAALLTGVPGIVVVSAAIALAHHIRQGRGLGHVQRVAFNWAVHLLAGFAPLVVVGQFQLRATVSTHALLELMVPALAAGLAYFAIETGLIATAVALSDSVNPVRTWRRQYRWLAGHYIVLSALGLVLAVAYTQLDVAGILVFVIPVFMMRYGQTQYVLHTRDSVGALERLSRDLSQAALTDGLTGLGNSRGFQIEMQRETDRAARRTESVSLARIDIDEFRVINEQRGTEAGDSVLVGVAALLRNGRAAGRAFRLGGDDFALILPHTNTVEASEIMERLRGDAAGGLDGATISVGIAELANGNVDYDQLREQADAALVDAKRRGRNSVVTFDELRDSVTVTSSAQALAVHQLIRDRKVEVCFQPIWDLHSASILAFEALTLPAAEYGLTGPQEAFNIAEQLRRAHDLDTVCREAILSQAQSLPPDALLFMNVSPQTLDLDLLAGDSLLKRVHAAGLPAERVVLEITERSMARLSVVVREAKRLRDMGFKLALDDTGAGNAGLEMLSQLPVDFVKVDKSVVTGAMTSKTARGVLAGIIAIARQTDTYVIVEGLESIAMLELARQIHASGGQGYLLGRPESTIPSAAAMVEARNLLRRDRLAHSMSLSLK